MIFVKVHRKKLKMYFCRVFLINVEFSEKSFSQTILFLNEAQQRDKEGDRKVKSEKILQSVSNVYFIKGVGHSQFEEL